jgi:hypothetical protein
MWQPDLTCLWHALSENSTPIGSTIKKNGACASAGPIRFGRRPYFSASCTPPCGVSRCARARSSVAGTVAAGSFDGVVTPAGATAALGASIDEIPFEGRSAGADDADAVTGAAAGAGATASIAVRAGADGAGASDGSDPWASAGAPAAAKRSTARYPFICSECSMVEDAVATTRGLTAPGPTFRARRRR